MTDKIPPLVHEALSDGDPPRNTKIALFRANIVAIELKLKNIGAEQAEVADRIRRGEPVKGDLARHKAELEKARSSLERKHLFLASHLAELERGNRS